MNVTLLSDIARRRLVRRSIRLLAPAMLLTPLFVAERAEAACTPPSPVNNTTVSCTGTTTNANGTNGYGTATDVGNTYNIGSGATLTGTGTGLVFDTGTVRLWHSTRAVLQSMRSSSMVRTPDRSSHRVQMAVESPSV